MCRGRGWKRNGDALTLRQGKCAWAGWVEGGLHQHKAANPMERRVFSKSENTDHAPQDSLDVASGQWGLIADVGIQSFIYAWVKELAH